ncbi:MAG: glycosyltransferase family 4 protein [Methanothrix sp.]|nr:glycosyltransferase family 4 protein [Methanothrix sp.]
MLRSAGNSELDGHDTKISFIYYSANSPFIESDYKMLSSHFLVNKFRYKRIWNVFGMMGVVWRSDVSFSWFAGGHAFLAVLFSKFFRRKSVVVVGGFEVAYAPEINYGQFTLGWNKKALTKFVLKHADLVLPVSDFTKNEVLSYTKPKNIIVVYNGIDTDRFKPEGEKCDLVITVASGSGSIIRLKGLDIFIAAAGYLSETEFIVLGLSETDMDTLKTFNPPKNVKLFGRLSQDGLIKWYQKAKAYCQLSYRESFGVALAEAMSCGCVPVVSERGALPEVVGCTGFYVPYGDPEATAEAIKKALASSGDLGKEARKRVTDNFSIKQREANVVHITNKLLEMQNGKN